VLRALQGRGGEVIRVPEEIADKASHALRKMLEIGGKG
jgi:quinolinate synthase